ncbi:TPA: IS110 family transposase, partial [Vibrio parahaemolyticus]
MGAIIRVGVDLAKNVFHIHAVDENEKVDAEAICEAINRPNMRFVSVKTSEQQDIQSMHRVRKELIAQRTARVNQIRGLTAEYGIIAPVGISNLRKYIPCWLEDAENSLSFQFRELLQLLYEDLISLDERIDKVTDKIKLNLSGNPVAQRLMKVIGIGPLVCSALLIDL